MNTIYQTADELDHDTDLLLEELLSDLEARGVARRDALASLRRALRGLQ